VFLVGFDGIDPTLARQFMAEGKLPNLSRLAREGTFSPLQTTQPSESPTAWASFATGVNPGKHNIFDFLVRDLETYMPDLAMVRKEPPEFLWGLVPTKKPRILSTRGGTSFWVHAGRDGIASVVLTVPVTFPVEGVHHSDLLTGFPLPDIRGTVGTFSYWATDLSPAEAGNTEFGGILERLVFDDGVASTGLVGPDNPVVVQQEGNLRARRAEEPEAKRRLDTLGRIRPAVIENNTKRWSGDHCGTAREISAGVLFTNRRLAREAPHILDFAPTILRLLEVPLPADLDGRPFL
jgi:predicted AlkP superfamily phosphohydrolase/phosphomutase